MFVHAADPARLDSVTEDERLDDYHLHEALDRVALVERLVDSELGEHPAIKAHPQWAVRIDTVCAELAKLYQEIGAEHLVPRREPSFETVPCSVAGCDWWVARVNAYGEAVSADGVAEAVAHHRREAHSNPPCGTIT